MKYILILFGAIIIARIDVVLHGIESIFNKVEDKKNAKMIESTDLAPPQATEIISIKEDKTLKVTPRLEFFTLMEEFRLKPSNDLRNKIKTVCQKNPNLFSETLDGDLEAQIYKMADLIYNKSNEFAFLLVDMTEILKSENLEMIQKFFTIMMDSNPHLFMSSYSQTKDKNCMVAKSFGLKIPEDEILNELFERKKILEEYINQTKIDPVLLQFSKNCLLVLSLEIEKSQNTPNIDNNLINTNSERTPLETTTPLNVPQENLVPQNNPIENNPSATEPLKPSQG